eukprot:TRINITY_DN4810_c0_g1_i1.p1 TRINITY_DN4810_c0_g1~~TRINITY_DN4810_c0_g1_i1.p1  ORF type:complete len:504 (+),score=182.88 TRINITY_DN4810_c0_g1_i1:79-1590(+)
MAKRPREEDPEQAVAAAAGGPCGGFRYCVRPEVTVGLLILDRKRPWPSCKNPDTGREWRDDMLSKIRETLGNTPFTIYDCPERVDDDPSLRRALARMRRARCDVLVAVQPTISDGRLAPILCQEWEHTPVLWATPEEQTGRMIAGNSLVGVHLYGSTLRQLGRPFEMVYGNLDWALAGAQLQRGVQVCFAARYLRKSKVALIGHQAPGFIDVHPDPFLMSRTFGTIMQHVGLAEFMATAKALPEAAVAADMAKVRAELPLKTGQPFGAEEGDLEGASRVYLAVRALADTNNFDAVAIRCWPELPDPQAGLGAWSYLALSRLAGEGFCVSCEGDVDGALATLAAKYLGIGPVYLSDWLEHTRDTVTLWHGGFCPKQMATAAGAVGAPEVSRHFNNQRPGCLDSTLKEGIDVTVFRIWVCDGKYHFVCFEGRTQPLGQRRLLGNHGLVAVKDVDMVASFERWVQAGFPHHVLVVEGRHADRVSAFARQHGLCHVPCAPCSAASKL